MPIRGELWLLFSDAFPHGILRADYKVPGHHWTLWWSLPAIHSRSSPSGFITRHINLALTEGLWMFYMAVMIIWYNQLIKIDWPAILIDSRPTGSEKCHYATCDFHHLAPNSAGASLLFWFYQLHWHWQVKSFWLSQHAHGWFINQLCLFRCHWNKDVIKMKWQSIPVHQYCAWPGSKKELLSPCFLWRMSRGQLNWLVNVTLITIKLLSLYWFRH